MTQIVLSMCAGVLALLFAVGLIMRVIREDQGNEAMRNIAQAIQEGSQAFLRREYTFLALFVIAIFIILVQNGLNLLRINAYPQMVVIGLLLALAVIGDNYREKVLLTLRN